MMAKAGIVTAEVVNIAVGPFIYWTPDGKPDVRGFIAGAIVAAVCSYLPDLDHGSSTAGQAIGKTSSKGIRMLLGGHRMGSHSAVFVAAIWAAVSWLLMQPALATAGAVGVGAHIWCDMLTKQGVGLFWPLTTRKFRLGNMTTGSKSEEIYVRLVQITGVILVLFYINQFRLGGTA